MQEGIIYLVTNTMNGKRYVGQTVKSKTFRWKKHLRDAKNGCSYAFHRAIRKYGADAFTVEVIAESLEPFLDTLEIFFIRLYRSHVDHHGYNVTEGGGGAKGFAHTPESRQKISVGNKGKSRNLGANFTDEHRRNMGLAQLGHTRNLGRKHTPETLRKMSTAQKGHSVSPETRQKIRDAQTRRWERQRLATTE